MLLSLHNKKKLLIWPLQEKHVTQIITVFSDTERNTKNMLNWIK